jgi:hypothetical protein
VHLELFEFRFELIESKLLVLDYILENLLRPNSAFDNHPARIIQPVAHAHKQVFKLPLRRRDSSNDLLHKMNVGILPLLSRFIELLSLLD